MWKFISGNDNNDKAKSFLNFKGVFKVLGDEVLNIVEISDNDKELLEYNLYINNDIKNKNNNSSCSYEENNVINNENNNIENNNNSDNKEGGDLYSTPPRNKKERRINYFGVRDNNKQ